MSSITAPIRSFIRASLAVAVLCSTLLVAPVATPAAGAWPSGVTKLSIPAVRLAGGDRFASAAAAAHDAYPGWAGIEHVVVASGDQAGLVDPLAASSLCWAYDAPLLLTSAKTTPAATRSALQAIVSANTTVTVHVVGGTIAVPSARVSEIRSLVGSGTVEQPWKTGGRYATAAGIANRVRKVAAETSRTVPNAVFVANGAEAKRFSDALAASAVSRATGIPVLLTAPAGVPGSTAAVIATGTPEVIVIGGSQAVSAAQYGALSGDARWWGGNKYSTATSVARNAVNRGWSTGDRVGIASSIADALAGASSLGRSGGVVLPTDSVRLPKELFTYLTNPPAPVSQVVVLGGSRAVADHQLAEVQGAPGRPRITAPSGKWVGKTMRVKGSVNSNTTRVALYVGGVWKITKSVLPYSNYDFGDVTSPSKSGTIEVRALNPDDKRCSATMTVERLAYPYPTCIVIDKSDFKLYWVRDNKLVKSYPIAIGAPGMETPTRTWKILAKYHTDPSSVYGPRKMRMFKQSGSGWEFTAYAIHGTNQPWVIGTKASHGCIRMYNTDVLELFPQVPLGTYVITRQ